VAMQATDDLQDMGTGSEGSDLLLLAEGKEAHRLGEGDGAVGIKTAGQFVCVMIEIGGDGETASRLTVLPGEGILPHLSRSAEAQLQFRAAAVAELGDATRHPQPPVRTFPGCKPLAIPSPEPQIGADGLDLSLMAADLVRPYGGRGAHHQGPALDAQGISEPPLHLHHVGQGDHREPASPGPALSRPRHLALVAQRHQPQPGQPLDVGLCPELLAGMQRAPLHQRPAAWGPAGDHRHGGFHSQRPADECGRHPPAPAAGAVAQQHWCWGKRGRWERRSGQAHHRVALTSGVVRTGSTPQRAANVLEQQQQVQRIGG